MLCVVRVGALRPGYPNPNPNPNPNLTLTLTRALTRALTLTLTLVLILTLVLPGALRPGMWFVCGSVLGRSAPSSKEAEAGRVAWLGEAWRTPT